MTHAHEVERLRHALGVYRATIEAGGHRQSVDFHRTVAHDAEWTLALATGVPCTAPSTWHRRPTLKEAIREVYSELVVICHEIAGGSLRARRHAAALLGLPYGELTKWMRS